MVADVLSPSSRGRALIVALDADGRGKGKVGVCQHCMVRKDVDEGPCISGAVCPRARWPS